MAPPAYAAPTGAGPLSCIHLGGDAVNQEPRASSLWAGQAMTEFLIVSGMAWFMILGTIQLALITNAHTMLKLAAFNAARAAITTRADKPEDPVTRDQMRPEAELAAWLTVIPVMPWVVGRSLNQIFTTNPTVTANGFRLLMAGARAGGPPNALKLGLLLTTTPFLPPVMSQRSIRIAEEFARINVKFYKAKDSATLFPPGTDVDSVAESDITNYAFDDRSRADDGLVRVVVKWQYPLIIPFADRIICAAVRGCNRGLYIQTNVPAWAAGTSLYGLAPLINLGPGNPFRIPLYATYVMRTQWDRNDP